jgi:hypothetical protein
MYRRGVTPTFGESPPATKEVQAVSAQEIDQMDAEMREMGPIDYAIFAWPGNVPVGAGVVPLIVDLVERGVIRVLDIAFVAKDADGNTAAVDLEQLGPDNPFTEFEGASSGMLDFDDLDAAAEELEPNSAAAVLVWENKWAAPVAVAIRKSGGLLIDGGRIPVQAIIAALDALEAAQVD